MKIKKKCANYEAQPDCCYCMHVSIHEVSPQKVLVFLSENASRPFLKVNCISQFYLFQRAKQTEQNSKWDH